MTEDVFYVTTSCDDLQVPSTDIIIEIKGRDLMEKEFCLFHCPKCGNLHESSVIKD